ncbi:MAG TPA: hypothetical protein VKZ63_06060 [Kofleriaceae bacterium]|nr:hypothetical protein [Kofleriaceae bacterium]
MSATARLPWALLACASLLACTGDDEVTPDASQPLIDSGTPDGPGEDVEDLCPGELTFEALVLDLESDAAVFEVSVAQVGDESNAATSAPNGRAVLCLPDEAGAVRSTKEEYLARLDRVDPEAVRALAATATPYPLHVIGAAAFDELLAGVGVTPDDDAGHVVVTVLAAADGQPVTGATVALDKTHGGAFARDDSGALAAGDEIGSGGLVLLANVELAGGGPPGEVEVTVTLPGDFEGTGTCRSNTGDLEAGALTGVVVVCE